MTEDPGTRRMSFPVTRDEPEEAPAAGPRHAERSAATTPVLVVNRGPQAGMEISLERPQMTLGRSATCDIVLDDVTVSRQHAHINAQSGQYVVSDAGSLNGTYLNLSPVDREIVLNDGDELRIGIFRLTFRA